MPVHVATAIVLILAPVVAVALLMARPSHRGATWCAAALGPAALYGGVRAAMAVAAWGPFVETGEPVGGLDFYLSGLALCGVTAAVLCVVRMVRAATMPARRPATVNLGP